MAEDIILSKEFIEQFLPTAPPSYVSIYLMTLAIGAEDAAEVAARLDILKSDVLRGWKYWEEKGIRLDGKEQANLSPSSSSSTSPPEAPIEKISLPVTMERRPEYSPAELAEYLKHADVKRLFQAAQKTLGKMLSQQDMNMLYSFYDWLGLPIEVIEVLLSYCVSHGGKGMRYVEKVALNWAEEGVDTVEKAAEYIEMRQTGYRSVMRAFGQGTRMPVAAEEGYMKKWLRMFSLEVIQVACERTVLQAGKASFPYADKILSKWRDAGVKNLGDIETLDMAFAAKKEVPETEQKIGSAYKPKQKQNRFINYTQREWDFDELAKLERENREKW